MDEDVERLYSITGQPPPLGPPRGCRFAARCPYADDRCRRDYPPAFTVGDGHTAACWRLDGSNAEPILRAQGLTKHFPVTQGLIWTKVVGWVKAVDGISFSVPRGDARHRGRVRLRQDDDREADPASGEPTAGQVFVDGKDVHALNGDDLKEYRTIVQAVFQDPWSS